MINALLLPVVLFDAGSRHEVDYPSGVSHMLEKMAFQVLQCFLNLLIRIVIC